MSPWVAKGCPCTFRAGPLYGGFPGLSTRSEAITFQAVKSVLLPPFR